MGIAGPQAWHSPPFPAWRGQQGPAQRGGGFALLAVCPPTLFSCSGITNSPFPKSLWTLCFVVWGLRSNPLILGAGGAAASRCPGPGEGLDVGCPGPGEGGQGWGFCPPLSLGLVGVAASQCPSHGEGDQGLDVGCPSPKVVAKGWKLPPCPCGTGTCGCHAARSPLPFDAVPEGVRSSDGALGANYPLN